MSKSTYKIDSFNYILISNSLHSFIIPKLSFKKIIKKIAYKYKNGLRFKTNALELIQIAMESYIILLFQECNYLKKYNQTNIIDKKHIQLARRMFKS